MHSATLYKYDIDGQRDQDTPIARITVDENACVDIRMLDGGLLVSMSLEQLGYHLLWDAYPTVSAFLGARPRV